MSLECDRIQENLLFHVDGAEFHPEVERHLKECPACREKGRSILMIKNLLSNLPRKRFLMSESSEGTILPLLSGTPRKSLPEGFDLEILNAIRMAKATTTPSLGLRILRLVQPMAAAVLILLLSGVAFHALHPKPYSSPGEKVIFEVKGSHYFHTLNSRGIVADDRVGGPGSVDTASSEAEGRGNSR